MLCVRGKEWFSGAGGTGESLGNIRIKNNNNTNIPALNTMKAKEKVAQVGGDVFLETFTYMIWQVWYSTPKYENVIT